MFVHSCCCIMSLQVGCVVVSVISFTLCYLILDTILMDYSGTDEFPYNLIVILVFIVLLFTVGVTSLVGAYYEHRYTVYFSMYFLFLTLIYWIVFVTLAFTMKTDSLQIVCNGNRCAMSLWMIPLVFRNFKAGNKIKEISNGQSIEDDNTIFIETHNIKPLFTGRDIHEETRPITEQTDQIISNDDISRERSVLDTVDQILNNFKEKEVETDGSIKLLKQHLLYDDVPKYDYKKCKSLKKTNTFIAAFLIVLIFFLFFFSGFTLLNYALQLQEEELREEEDFELGPPF